MGGIHGRSAGIPHRNAEDPRQLIEWVSHAPEASPGERELCQCDSCSNPRGTSYRRGRPPLAPGPSSCPGMADGW